MVPRDKINYVVSFIGFAPADDPQIAIYCVIDRPNVAKQASASYATGVVKNILTEVLPYLHISKTEEMTIAEQEEVDRMLGNIVQGNTPENEDGNGDAPSDGTKEGEQGEQGEQEGQEGQGEAEDKKPSYIVDPDTGELVDPDTGEKAQMNDSADGEADGDADSLPVGVSGRADNISQDNSTDNTNGPPQQ